MLHAALWYADLGYPVFPCAAGRKAPLIEHGLLEATTDAEQIRAWWTKHPDANVAIRTDGLVVIDIDGEGNAWLANEAAKLAELDVAPLSLTPRGGRHYFFQQLEDRAWRSTAGRLASRVDTRANGGYVLVAPSVVEGKPYSWQDERELSAPPQRLPEPPAWLIEMLDALAASNGVPGNGTPANVIPEGQRNEALARLGGAMRRVGMSQAEIFAALQQVNADRCAPPLPLREVERTAASVARYAPDAVSVALAENHWAQDHAPSAQPTPLSVRELMVAHRTLRAPIIQGLLRRGETMNVIAPSKTGKALAVDTPILTDHGWMTMGVLQPGMKVHAGDGSLTEIVAVSEVMHDRPCYRVTSKSGASVVADEEHQWAVFHEDGPHVVTTAELGTWRWGRRWLLPVAGPLERPESPLLLDPWLLGYWLGNGTTTSGELTANRDDFDEVVDQVQRARFGIGNPHHKPGAVTFTVLGLESVLRRLGLLRCKHIPTAYLLASRAQRAALLAGLLDSDGHAATQANGSGEVEFSTGDPDLFFQVLELARSLGHKASTSVGRAKLNGRDCGHKLRVRFAASRLASPFHLARRTRALPERPLSQRSRRDAVVEVVPVASVPVRCIQVAHPSGTFLAGRDFMVTHNSWLVLALAMAVATGRKWLDTFETVTGDVLIIDNELHAETLAHRIPQVAECLRIGMNEITETISVQSLRGQLRDIFSMRQYFESIEPGRYALVVLDAFYRFMPRDMDENDNGTMANIYNHVDALADRLGCSFVLIHHATKGNQSAKAVTDVGAGAGSQSRATDTHLVLRPHEEPGAVVLEAAVRSWPPVEPMTLRWLFPVWKAAPDLDPTALRSDKPKRKSDTQNAWTPESFVAAFVTDEPRPRDAILAIAAEAGMAEWKAAKFLRQAEAQELIFRWNTGRNRPSSFATVAPPAKSEVDEA